MTFSLAPPVLLSQHRQDGFLFSITRNPDGKVVATKDGETVTLKGELPGHLSFADIDSAQKLLGSGRKFVWDQTTQTLTFQLLLFGGGGCVSSFPNPNQVLSRQRTDEAIPHMNAIKEAIGRNDEKGIEDASKEISSITFDKVPNQIFNLIRGLVEAITLTDSLSFSTRYYLATTLHAIVDLAVVYCDGIEAETLQTMGDLLDVPLSKLDEDPKNLQIRFYLESAKEGLKSFYQLDPQLKRFLQKAYKVSGSDDTNGNGLPITDQLIPNFLNIKFITRSWYFKVLVARALYGKISNATLFNQYTFYLKATKDWHTLYALIRNLGEAATVYSFSSEAKQEVAAIALTFLVHYLTGQPSKVVVETDDWRIRYAASVELSSSFYDSPYQKIILSFFAERIVAETDARVKKNLEELQKRLLTRREECLKKKKEEMGKAIQKLEEGHFLDFYSQNFKTIQSNIVSQFDKGEPEKEKEANIAKIKKIVHEVSDSYLRENPLEDKAVNKFRENADRHLTSWYSGFQSGVKFVIEDVTHNYEFTNDAQAIKLLKPLVLALARAEGLRE